MTEPVRTISGWVTISSQLITELQKTEAAWSELEWIARHYDEATPEQRARLDAFFAAQDRLED